MNYPRYPEYKLSGIEWLGEVPAHWEVWKLAHAFHHIASGTTPPATEYQWYDGDVPWVTTGELRENVVTETAKRVTTEAVSKFSALKIHPAGALVIAMYGATIGRLGILGVPAATNQACCVLAEPTVLDIKFSFYCFQAFREDVIRLSSGGGQPNISQEKVASLRFPTPPIEQQRAIAAFLDRETARIDALIAKKQRLIELLAEKRTALISQAVTKGLNPDVPMKDSGVEWLGEIPARWNTPPLYARYSVELGKMLNESRITGDHLVPYLRNVDVQWDAIRFDDLPGMDIPASEYQRYSVRKGDLLVCEGGEVGRAAIVGEIDSVVGYQKALHRLRATSSSEAPRFMYYTLYWAVNTGVFNVGGVSTIAHLTGEQLRRYRFPKPPVLEQHAIADHLDRQTLMLDAMRAKVETAIEKLKEYRAALIADAVTGKIDVRSFAKEREVA